jgi:integrase
VSASVYRRCGCRDEYGRQCGRDCPKLKSDPKHGSWAYYLSHGSDPRTHQRRQYRKAGFKTKAAAASAVAKLKASLDTGTYVEPSKKTLAEYAPEILARRRTTGSGLKPTTMATYERYVRQDIVPSKLGEMLLTDIRRSHVNAWIAELTAAGRGAVTVRRGLATLRMIFSAAVRDEIIPANPALMVDKPAVPDHPVTASEPEHVGEFIERCGRHRLGPLFELAIDTGLRRGEITGLHWSDVDLAARTIIVRHNRVTVNGRVQETTTKTRSGRRTVPLSDFGVAALLTWKLTQAGEAEMAQEAWVGDGHVFTMEDGRPLDPQYVSRLFQKIRTQGEPLPELTFHGLRHSAASLFLAGGADISTVSKLLGHSSIAVTADIYAHMLKGVGQRAVDGAAALIPRKVALTVHTQPGVQADAG